MDKLDARKLPPTTQNYLRQQAIRLRKDGKPVMDIAAYLGVHRNTVTRWWHESLQGGESAFYQHPRGRRRGEKRTLSIAQETRVQQVIVSAFPDSVGIDSALWTRRAVQQFIQHTCQVRMPLRTVGEYLKRWGYSPQKPLKRAYEQDPKAVQYWLDHTYPELERRARSENAEIAWGDESGLRSDTQVGRGFAPIGETPEIHLSQKNRVRVNLIASITNQGTVRFMLYTCKLTEAVLLSFLKRLIANRQRKLFWIVDQHPVHRGKQVQQWLSQHRDEIEVFYLPSYSPQLNPAEYLNGDIKQGVHSKPPTRNLSQLKQRVMSHLRKLQKLPSRVQKYFEHPFIAYAADKKQPL